MYFFRIFLFIGFLGLTFCKESVKPITLSDDKIHGDYMKQIELLEADLAKLNEKNQIVDTKIADTAPNQKFIELLKKQRFTYLKFLDAIVQKINFLKIKAYSRQKYIVDHPDITLDELEKQFAEYETNKSVNVEVLPWRINNPSPIEKHLVPTAPKEAPKPDAHGGGGH